MNKADKQRIQKLEEALETWQRVALASWLTVGVQLVTLLLLMYLESL